jgi:arabinofuranosyltransferase
LTAFRSPAKVKPVAPASDGAVAVAEPEISDPTPPPRTFSARNTVQGAVFALPPLVLLGAGWAHRATTEDAFIYLRVVRQIRDGHGPVFNIGQRVEAFTGPLWVAILAVADLVTPIRLEQLADGLGLALAVAGVVFAMLGARRLWSDATGDALFVPLGALVFVVLLPVWIYTSDGLETGLVFGWLGASVWILSGWARRPDDRLSTTRAVVLGLGWLIRPEMVLFSALFFVLVLAVDRDRTTRRDQVRVALAMLALPVAYQIFRMGYYGSLVANTAVAKSAGSTNWSRGARYVRDFTDPYWLWVPALALIFGGYLPLAMVARSRSRALWVAGVFVIGAAVLVVYVIAVGGDYLHARLLLPSLFALCAPVAAVPATRRHLAGLLVVPWAIAALFALRPDQYKGNFLAHGFEITMPNGYGFVTVDQDGWGANGLFRRWYRGPGYYYEGGTLRYVRADIPVADDVRLPLGAFYGVGISSYALGSDFSVMDLLGLADSFTAHLELTPSATSVPRFAGHEKPLPAPWIAARLTRPGTRPDPKDFPNFGNPAIPPTTGAAFQEQVAWARAALKCPDLARLMAAADAPMTPRRFAANFVHSFGNTRVQIPNDPERAYRKFCGSGTPAEVAALRPR